MVLAAFSVFMGDRTLEEGEDLGQIAHMPPIGPDCLGSVFMRHELRLQRVHRGKNLVPGLAIGCCCLDVRQCRCHCCVCFLESVHKCASLYVIVLVPASPRAVSSRRASAALSTGVDSREARGIHGQRSLVMTSTQVSWTLASVQTHRPFGHPVAMSGVSRQPVYVCMRNTIEHICVDKAYLDYTSLGVVCIVEAANSLAYARLHYTVSSWRPL